jgi:hypothetical protein
MRPFHYPLLFAVLVTIVISCTACTEFFKYLDEHSVEVASTEYVYNSGYQKGNKAAVSAPSGTAPARDVATTDSAAPSAKSTATQVVTATGYGMNVEEAKRAGVRAAVEAVVGTMVDAETLVENDELIRDKILSYSAGMVEDVKIIGEPQQTPEGLVTVRVQVKVRNKELAERVKTTINSSAKIDGEGLYQKVAFNQQNLNNAGEIIKNLFSPERMQGLIKFDPEGIDVDEATGEVTVSIKGGVNLEAYKQWTDEIIEKLTPMATEKKTGMKDPGWDGDSYYGGHSYYIDIVGEQGLSILRSFRSFEVIGLVFDKNKRALLQKQFEHYDDISVEYLWIIHVSLLDKKGNKIKAKKIILNWDGDDEHALIYASYRGVMVIVPAFTPPGGGSHMVSFSQANVSLGRLSLQDLRKIDSVSVECVLEKDH